jgi:hypothetical protein
MDAAMLCPRGVGEDAAMTPAADAQLVDATAFRELLVSHRRMVRVDRRQDALRGLQDLDTGEVFLVDERRLFQPR